MSNLYVSDINPLSGESDINLNGNVYVENSLGTLVNVSDYLRLEKDYSNLLIINNTSNPTYQLDISYDHMYIGTVRDTQTSPVTLDATVNGDWASGTAAEPTSDWIYVWNWAKANGTTKQFFDLSATSPTTPTDYVHSKLISAVYNDSGDDFVRYNQVDNIVNTQTTDAFIAQVTSATYAAADISGNVPILIIRTLSGIIYCDSVGNGGYVSSDGYITSGYTVGAANGNPNGFSGMNISGNNIYCKSATGTVSIQCISYTIEI